jgi:hypothetical protein
MLFWVNFLTESWELQVLYKLFSARSLLTLLSEWSKVVIQVLLNPIFLFLLSSFNCKLGPILLASFSNKLKVNWYTCKTEDVNLCQINLGDRLNDKHSFLLELKYHRRQKEILCHLVQDPPDEPVWRNKFIQISLKSMESNFCHKCIFLLKKRNTKPVVSICKISCENLMFKF